MACDRDNDFKHADVGKDYFPMQTGFYQIYKIDEIVYTELKDPETLSYQLMIEVVDSFPNPEGHYTYVLNRSKRLDANAQWKSLDTWSVRSNDREIIVNEENIPFLKLTFPVRKGSVWNGNKFNNLQEDAYEILTVDQSSRVNEMEFDKTLTVLQENNKDLIVFQDKREEVYARGVGLIYKETLQLHYCTDNNCVGQQKIKRGSDYKQQIIAYGHR